ncbi:MAG: hypothetical protein LBU27_03340 [Candidatus Peribacteria bacterium]|jgi:hypothetical protein|nr:hypothetical protein [Candidatus Peribacteria bacterium]
MINKCTICGGSQKSFLKGKDYLYQTNVGKTFEIVKCENCGLEQIYPIPTDKEIASFYANNYYSYKKSDK